MATTAARHLRMVIMNLANVLAIEFICATQALALRTTKRDLLASLMGSSGWGSAGASGATSEAGPSISEPCAAAVRIVQASSPFVVDDGAFADVSPHSRIERVRDAVFSGNLLRTAVKGLQAKQ